MKKALIFGGSGQIGAAAAQTLARAGWQILAMNLAQQPHGLDRYSPGLLDFRPVCPI
jgi:NAD(P)-dependent dehydrogenase (short-subunit alcohol dehydrogenase family)